MGEAGRLRFLVRRDGVQAAVEWAGRTMRTYRQVVLQHRATMYRRPLIESYLALKRFLRGYRQAVPVTDLLDEIERCERSWQAAAGHAAARHRAARRRVPHAPRARRRAGAASRPRS